MPKVRETNETYYEAASSTKLKSNNEAASSTKIKSNYEVALEMVIDVNS